MDKNIMIKVKNLEKSFQLQKVLKGINLELKEGNIYGLVGRNGCGKTVLMRCILGILHPDCGEIWVTGKKIGDEVEFAPHTGFLIETPGFFLDRSGYSNLKYLYGINHKVDKGKIMRCLDEVGLLGEEKKKVGKYSMGMRQRLGIAQALMENPHILILDEPMNGLDNQGVKQMRDKLMSWRENGTTILIASHNREDIDMLCDEVFVMDDGIITKERKGFI